MSIVNEAVETGIGQGGIADDLVPLLDRNLAGDDCGAAPITVFEDLEQIDALALS